MSHPETQGAVITTTDAVAIDEATLLRLLVDAAQDFAIFAVEPGGTILTWNPGVRNVTGYEEHEFIGQNCAMLFTPEDRETGAPEHERETARRDGRALDERWHLKKDGTRFWGSGFMHGLREGHALRGDEDGQVIGFAKILRDMTAQKRYEEELEARVRERTRQHVDAQRQMLTIQEQERRRISRELHNSTGQHLAALGLELSLLESAVNSTRAAAAESATVAREAATLASEASHASELAVKVAALAGSVPEAAVMARTSVATARTAAVTSMDAAMAASAADAAVAAINAAVPGAQRLRELTKELSHDLHRLAVDLRPTSLDDLGLVAALRAYAESCAAARAGVVVMVESIGMEEDGDAARRLPFDVETALYRIAQEALTNVAKHAVPGGATKATVTLQRIDGIAPVTVEDDGPGFDPAAGTERLGLVGMRERAALLGGTLEIESAPGRGTTVFLKVPIDSGAG